MTNDNAGQNEFAAVLMQHAKGRAHDKATELLAAAVEAVRDTGKSATVTVQLKINPVKNNETVVAIEDKVTASIPEEKRGSMCSRTTGAGSTGTIPPSTTCSRSLRRTTRTATTSPPEERTDDRPHPLHRQPLGDVPG